MKKYIFGNIKDLVYNKNRAEFKIDNKILNITGRNYYTYIYPILDELYSLKTFDELFLKINPKQNKRDLRNFLDKMVNLNLIKIVDVDELGFELFILDLSGNNYSNDLHLIIESSQNSGDAKMIIVFVNRYNAYKLIDIYRNYDSKYFFPIIVDEYISFYTCITKNGYLENKDSECIIESMINMFYSCIVDMEYSNLSRGNFLALLGDIYKEISYIIDFERSNENCKVKVFNSIMKKNNLTNQNYCFNMGRNPSSIKILEEVISEK